MSLADELNQKQALKFQVETFNKDFILQTLNNTNEGIFNLNSKINSNAQKVLYNFLRKNYSNFNFESERKEINPKIYFKKS